MTTSIATLSFSEDQLDLIKRTIANGATNDELQLFMMQCKRTGLDPFARQIHLVKRKVWNPDTRESEDRATIQVGIDGYRLVADRTGRYAPGRANSFEYDSDGKLVSATAYVQKLVQDKWMECAATAHFAEYAQIKKDGVPTKMWAEKPHIMLGKCAEALALRRAFPAELSGVYTDDEMPQANDARADETQRHATVDVEITQQQPPLQDRNAMRDAWLAKMVSKAAFSDSEQAGLKRGAQEAGFNADDIADMGYQDIARSLQAHYAKVTLN
jgi:phage recombination protein Bet